jgi:hypothetical protein
MPPTWRERIEGAVLVIGTLFLIGGFISNNCDALMIGAGFVTVLVWWNFIKDVWAKN